MKRIATCLLLLLVFCYCSDKRDFETYIGDLGIQLTGPYKVDSIKQTGITDWTLKAAVDVHDNDKDMILNTIKKLGKVKKVSSREFYFDSVHVRKDSIYSFIIGSKYYFGLYKTRYDDDTFSKARGTARYETYKLNLDTLNNKAFFTYEYE